MSDKYYTPILEELHVGLYCEYSKLANTEGHNHSNWGIRDDVVEGEIDTLLLTWIINDIVENGCEMPIRVKCLDKNDIESLGFKYNNNYQVFSKQKDEESGWGIKLFQNEIIIDYVGGCIFKGRIKNKSELVKLFKQLNITTDEK